MWDDSFSADPEDPTPPAFERSATHTARRHHACADCGNIAPGERYRKHVRLDDDEGFMVIKNHEDRKLCEERQEERQRTHFDGIAEQETYA